jgi:hypothetical protein
VTTLDGEAGIVDIMLSRRIPQTKQEDREHLVIELKRPSRTLNSEAIAQIEKYAFAVAEDERFKDANTRWVFWLVSNNMDDFARRKVTRQANRPDGVLHQAEDKRLTIWVKTWGQVIESCKARLRFYEERLSYMATHDTGLDYLRRTHAKYLPEEVAASKAAATTPQVGNGTATGTTRDSKRRKVPTTSDDTATRSKKPKGKNNGK